MRYFAIAAVLVGAVHVAAQTCIVPAPPRPPTPKQLIVTLPVDGGTVGCIVESFVPGSAKAPGSYVISNVKCATAVQMAKQAAATDNGWDDGGTP